MLILEDRITSTMRSTSMFSAPELLNGCGVMKINRARHRRILKIRSHNDFL